MHEGQREHTFADAIAWFRNDKNEATLDAADLLAISESDLDTVKDIRGLTAELNDLIS